MKKSDIYPTAYKCPYCSWIGFQRFTFCSVVNRIVDMEKELKQMKKKVNVQKLTIRLESTINNSAFEEYSTALEPILKKYGGVILITDEEGNIIGSPYACNPEIRS